MKKSNIKKNFIWNLIGVTLYGFVSLFLLLIVKHVNGFEDSGIFSFAYSICTLFFYICIYYNRTYQISNYNNNKNFNDFFSFRLLFTVIGFITLIIYCLISKFSFYKIEITILLMLYRGVDAISETFYGYFHEKDYLYYSGISYTIKSLISIITFFVIDLITQNLLIASSSIAIVNIIIFILYDIKKYKKLSNNKKIQVSFRNSKLIVKEAFSIFIFSFLSIFMANCQKYVLTYYSDNTMQSIFAIIIMPATVLSLVGTYLINPFTTSLKNYEKKKNFIGFNKLLNKILLVFFGIGILGLIFCYFFGMPILNMLYSENLNKYKIQFLLIIIGSSFNAAAVIISSVLVLLKKNSKQVTFYVIGSIISLLVCIIGFKSENYIDIASKSYLISYFILFIIYFIYYNIIVSEKKSEKYGKRKS